MSDKSYTPASGITFLARRAPGNALEITKEGEVEGAKFAFSPESARLDHQTQRVLLTRPDGSRSLFWVYARGTKRVLSWPGGSIELDANDLTEGGGGASGALKPLKLTMPGKVLSVKVKEGDLVEAGQGLVVVEAMKMENLLLAPAKAKVAKVHVQAGDRLESGATLISFEPAT